jgi:hypothetical protein
VPLDPERAAERGELGCRPALSSSAGLTAWRSAGVDRVLLMLPSAERPEFERAADEAAAVAQRMR